MSSFKTLLGKTIVHTMPPLLALKASSPIVNSVLGTHTGSWGTPDFGITERLRGQSSSPLVNQIHQDDLRKYNFGTQPSLNIPVLDTKKSDVLGLTTNTPSFRTPQQPQFQSFADIASQVEKRADDARSRAIQQARDIFYFMQSQYNQGMGALQQKREQFKKLFDDTAYDIDQAEEQKKGQLQRAAIEQSLRTARLLRALGLESSAVGRAEGRQTQENMRALASVLAERMKSDQENMKNFQNQNLWADQQENALQNFLQQAALQRQAAENQTEASFHDILNQLDAQKLALGKTAQSIESYEPQKIAFDPAQWTAVLNNPNTKNFLGNKSFDNEFVNLQEESPMQRLLRQYLERLKGLQIM